MCTSYVLTDCLFFKDFLEEDVAHPIPHTSASSSEVNSTSHSGEDNNHKASANPEQCSHPSSSQLDKDEHELVTSVPDLPNDSSHVRDASGPDAFWNLEPVCDREYLSKVKKFDCCIIRTYCKCSNCL